MKSINKDYLAAIIIAIILTIAIFWQFFIKGLHPFPANYMLAWYEPWKGDYVVNGTITIPHKPIADDTFRYLYPFKVLGMEILKNGELPLWNPYSGSGMPLLATLQWGFFNPFNILFLFLPNYLAWTLHVILQVFFLSLFTYLYCRKIDISIKGAIFSTIVFVCSGFIIIRLIFGNIVYPLIALPLLLYLIEIFLKGNKSKKLYFIPLIVAFSIISGHPHMTFYVLVFSFSYFLYKILTANKNNKIIKTVFFTALVLLGLGLTGIQIIPAIELLVNANINPQSSQFIFNRFLLPISHLITILIPNYFGNQATYNYWGAGDYIETVASVGLIPCFFVLLAYFKNSSPTKNVQKFYKAAALITVLSTLNWFIPKLLSTLPIPIVSTGPPSRVFVLTTFSLAILAGYGFDRWFSLKKIDKNILFQCGLFIFAIFALFLSTFFLYVKNISCNNIIIYNCRLIALRNTSLETFFFVVVLILLFAYFFFKKNSKIQYIPYIIIFFTLGLGLYNSNKTLPFSAKETILQNHQLIKALQNKTGIYRVFGLDSANIKTNLATHFKFFDPNYFDPLYNKRYGELIGFANTKVFPPPLTRSDVEIVRDIKVDKNLDKRRLRLFNLIGVKYLIYKMEEIPKNPPFKNILWANNDWTVRINENTLPRAYITSQYEILSNKKASLERLFDDSFNYRKTVILEEQPTLYFPIDKNQPEHKLVISNYAENRVTINAQIQTNSFLVLSDNYYPGWKAFINGKETKIYRANYTFRAIEIPKGNHMVTFLYQPASLNYGIALSLISFILYGCVLIYIKRRGSVI